MKRSRFTTSQIIEAIERAEAGLDVSGLCWAPGVSFGHVLPMARPKYGGIDVSLMVCMKEREAGNARLRKRYVGEELKAEIVTEAPERKW